MARDRKIPDLADMFKDHEQRIRNLESNNRIINTGIQDGALIVKDASGNTIVELGKASDGNYGVRVNDQSGNPQVRVGQLNSGGYGIEAINSTGDLVSLSTLAFGIRGQQSPGDMNGGTAVTSTSYLTLPGSPSFTVTIGPSLRCIILVGVGMLRGTLGAFNAITGYTTVRGVGPSGQLTNTGDIVGVAGQFDATMDYFHDGCAAFFSTTEGLNEAGQWTFTLQCRVNAGSIFFGDGTLAVFPY